MGRARNTPKAVRRLLAFGLSATLGVAVGVFAMGEIADLAVEASAKDAAQAYERSRRIETYHDCRQLAGIEKLYCEDQAARRALEGERQQYEFAANEKAAIWTKAAGIAAALALFFNLVTIMAVFLTYLEQRIANRIQYSNFMDARRRARQALDHAQTVSLQELRPYVFVDRITSEQISERTFRVTIWLKNFGQTPARHLESVVTTYATYDLHKLRPHKKRADRIELGTAAPNACRRAMAPLRFSEKQWEAPAYDQAWGVLRIRYWYTDDSGGASFEEAFDYHTTPAELAKDEPIFYLLTESRVRRSEKMASRQGELVLHMRRRRRAQRKRHEEPEAEA